MYTIQTNDGSIFILELHLYFVILLKIGKVKPCCLQEIFSKGYIKLQILILWV